MKITEFCKQLARLGLAPSETVFLAASQSTHFGRLKSCALQNSKHGKSMILPIQKPDYNNITYFLP